MTRKIVLIAALPLFVLAGCGGKDVVKETIVERPVVTKETIIERPAPAAAVGASAPSCTYASRGYSHGSMACQEGREFRCSNGAWDRTEVFC
jgi:hypothetical protein